MRGHRATFLALILAAAVVGCSTAPGGTTPAASPSAAAVATSTPPPTVPPTAAPSPTSEPLAALVSDAKVVIPGGDYIVGTDDRLFVQAPGSVYAFDPATLAVTKLVADQGERWGVQYGFGSLWIGHDGGDRGWVERFDAVTGDSLAIIETGLIPVAMVPAFDAAWIANHRSRSITVVDPSTNEVTNTIEILQFDPLDITAGPDRIWAISPHARRLTGIDPATQAVVAEVVLLAETCAVRHLVHRIWIRPCSRGATYVHDGATGAALSRFDGNPLLGPGGELLAVRELEGDQFVIGRYDPETLEPEIEMLLVGRGAFVAGSDVWTIAGNELLRYPLDPLLG